MARQWEDELVELCRGMIRRQSLSGQEKDVADFVEDTMKKFGFDSTERDGYGNVSGRMTFGGGGKRILFEGHMDHVDVVDRSRWSHDPFGAEVVDGRIYGRGTSDMKGNLAAAIVAAKLLKEDPKGLSGEFIVCGGVHEECFEGVASEELGERWKPDCVIIGEASSLNLKRGQRGRAEVVLETRGKAAHSSNPDVGLNAIKTMVPLLAAIEKNFKPKEQPVLGRGILEVTDIISSPYPGASVVPERCRVTFDRRLLVGETDKEVLQQIQDIVDAEVKANPKIQARLSLATGVDTCYTGRKIEAERYAPAWLYPEDNWFVKAAMEGLRSAGLDPQLSHYAFCTNGSYYAGKAGIPTVGFGGSLESLAHVIDEYIEIDQLCKACQGYQGIVRSVLK